MESKLIVIENTQSEIAKAIGPPGLVYWFVSAYQTALFPGWQENEVVWKQMSEQQAKIEKQGEVTVSMQGKECGAAYKKALKIVGNTTVHVEKK